MSTNTPPSVPTHSEKAHPPDKASIEAQESFIEQRVPSPPSVRKSSENLNAKLVNPLAGISHEQLMADAAEFAHMHGLVEYTETLQKGALVAKDPPAFESLPLLTEEDRNVLRREFTHKRDQPWTLYYLVVMCSIAAAVQGMDKSVINVWPSALIASFGFGAVNFVFAGPTIWTIDTFGRRNLLLVSFPLMAAMLLMTGFAFWIPTSKSGVIALGIYLFTAAYSPGEGPVPFTYSVEAFPLYVRDIGMSMATALLWFFNFVIALTVPALLGAWTPQGTFEWFAAWNIFGFFAALLFVPETKALSLEELDQVFSVPTHIHATYQIRAFWHKFNKYVLRRKVGDMPPLYEHEGAIGEKTYAAPGGFGAA